MRDPLDELENFSTPGLTMNPLPASEVRRRGTRMRRRNHALAAIGGVAAVAIIATPLAMAASGNRTDTTPPPAPQPTPSVSWVQEIPADFPLADGLPTPVRTEASYDSPVTDICPGWAPSTAAEVRQAVFTESEGGSTHTLALYPTDREAELGLTALSAEMQACALQTEGKQRWVDVLPSDDDDQSLVYANHYSDGGDVDVVRLVRVGNAVLQATAYSLGTPAEDTAALVQERSASVVDAMCVFAADPC